jgi:hypothetical protein
MMEMVDKWNIHEIVVNEDMVALVSRIPNILDQQMLITQIGIPDINEAVSQRGHST